MEYFLVVLLALYLFLLLEAWCQWSVGGVKNETPNEPVSVVIVCRNEGENIKATIDSVLAGSYPLSKLEIIIVDDHSSDNTSALVKQYDLPQVRLLELKDFKIEKFGRAFKKAGQFIGINNASHDIILTTDGDCVCPPDWIISMVYGLGDSAVATGPIILTGSRWLLCSLQEFDIMATMLLTNLGITKKWWLSANAANMIFRKSIYNEYAKEASFEKASGDDILLLQYAERKGHGVSFVKSKNAIVSTSAQKTWISFFNQRLRWASKSGTYYHKGVNLLWVFLFLVSIVVLFVPGLFLIFPFYKAVVWIAIFWIVKMIADMLLLKKAGTWFGSTKGTMAFPIVMFVHALYVVIVGLLSMVSSRYEWKGREVS